jgi:hypothetical protein
VILLLRRGRNKFIKRRRLKITGKDTTWREWKI